MISFSEARTTVGHFALIMAIAGLMVAAFLVALTPTADAWGCNNTQTVYYPSTYSSCGAQPCSDFERLVTHYWGRIDRDDNRDCGGGDYRTCQGFRECGGIVSDPDGELPLGKPGQAALIACALDALPVTVDNTDDSVAASVNPTFALHWFS